MNEQTRTLDAMPSMMSLVPGIIKSLFRKGGSNVPQGTLVLKNVAIDKAHLADYQNVCGFEKSAQLPLTYLHVLAFNLQVSMLLDDGCDFPLLGLVHIENDITRHKPLSADDQYEYRCRIDEIGQHRKGKLLTLITEAYVNDELVWEGRATNLCRMKNPDFDSDANGQGEALPVGRRPLNNNAERWKLAADLGRRYAKISGDRNPIHLWKTTAKMLGFKQQIAHGMWSKARVCAAVEPGLGEGPVRVRCEFKQPIFLPAKVHFYHEQRDNAHAAEIWNAQGERLHLVSLFEKL